MQIQTVTFSEPKAGNAPEQWQDGAAGGVDGDGAGVARFIVVDGATQAYDSVGWVDQLVTSFVSPRAGASGTGRPRLEPAAMRAWFVAMQDQWASAEHVLDTVVEERMFDQVGSFATLLGFELSGLDGPEPAWRAAALGDTVLFHVRDERLIATFPPLGPGDFGTRPDGVHSLRSSLDRMSSRLLLGTGVLEAGDFLFAATDAMAHWILRAIGHQERKVWATLGGLAHPDVFARLIEDQRREQDSAKRMKNDDVTLMRLRMLAGPPHFLLACR